MIGELDQYLFREGKHWRLFELLGAHPRTTGGQAGVTFAVWAPHARAVRVVGDFNQWNGRQHALELHAATGIWHGFFTEPHTGSLYKYEVTDCHQRVTLRADPVGFYSEFPPRNASVVTVLDGFTWNDHAWMQQRAARSFRQTPWSIYEVHLGSWRTDPTREHGWRNYREIALDLVPYCREMGFTHLQLLPITEHPYTGSWGYQTTGYFAPTSRYGSPEDFMWFVDHCHRHGLGVLVDWVPGHFPRDEHGLRRFDGTGLYEHLDPRRGEHPDWGTMIFNFGRHEVSNFLISSALFWLEKYHVDGLRVDAVASMLYLDYSRGEGQWLPNEQGGRENLQAIRFLRQFNDCVHEQFPGVVTIAEESTAWPGVSRPAADGGLDFDMKWNMGWMNDTLRYFRREPIHRRYHHNEITFSIWYSFAENFVLPLSHDEVVHGKRSLIDQLPGDLWRKFANLRLLYGYMWTHPGKKLLFMGGEWGQWLEWSCDRELSWQLLEHESHRGVQRYVAELNRVYSERPALHQLDFHSDGFLWLEYQDAPRGILAFLRLAANPRDHVAAICNFTPTVVGEYRVGVPSPGEYQVLINSDESRFGGSGVTPPETLLPDPTPCHGQPYSLSIRVPPLGLLILAPTQP